MQLLPSSKPALLPVLLPHSQSTIAFSSSDKLGMLAKALPLVSSFGMYVHAAGCLQRHVPWLWTNGRGAGHVGRGAAPELPHSVGAVFEAAGTCRS